MRVIGSAIQMQSRHQAMQSYRKTESLRVWGRDRPDGDRGPSTGGDRLQLSPEASSRLEEQRKAAAASAQPPKTLNQISPEDELRILLLQKLLGLEVRVPVPLEGVTPPAEPARSESSEPPVREGWGLAYDSHEVYIERESLSVSMQGIINTADGRQISFEVQVGMSRSFMMHSHTRIRMGDARFVDPLVINFSGSAAELTTTRFEFDLDADGQAEAMPFLRPGSGFLALDRNGDGAINNGTELFGPGTGDGFSELAHFDEDGNGFIDEGDSVFSRLRIWTKDASGKDRLFALSEKGLGAIYVGAVDAPFTMKDMQNQALGRNVKAGLFLRENGSVGTVQQLDLVV